MVANILFITFDDESSPYLESLFKPILMGLKQKDSLVHIVQIVTGHDTRALFERSKVEQPLGILHERYLIPHKHKGLALLLLMPRLALIIKRFSSNNPSSTLIFRSLIPSLIVNFSRILKLDFAKVLYDSDGLAIDERAEFGKWSHLNFTYVIGRFLEYLSLGFATSVIVRSDNTSEVLASRGSPSTKPNFVKLLNGRDRYVFNLSTKESRLRERMLMNIEQNDPVLLYVGSIGPQYQIDTMLKVFREILLLLPNAKFLVLSFTERGFFNSQIVNFCEQFPGTIIRRGVDANSIPKLIEIADLGISIRGDSFSMKHVAPLKLREYMLCGLPVIYSSNTGDNFILPDDISMKYSFSADDPGAVAMWFKNTVMPMRDIIRVESRKYAEENFSLDKDVARLKPFV